MVPFSRYLDDSTFIQVSSLKTKLKNTMKIQNEISRDTKMEMPTVLSLAYIKYEKTENKAPLFHDLFSSTFL